MVKTMEVDSLEQPTFFLITWNWINFLPGFSNLCLLQLLLLLFLGQLLRDAPSQRISATGKLSGSCQAVVRQSSGSRQAVVRQSSGSRQAVLRQMALPDVWGWNVHQPHQSTIVTFEYKESMNIETMFWQQQKVHWNHNIHNQPFNLHPDLWFEKSGSFFKL